MLLLLLLPLVAADVVPHQSRPIEVEHEGAAATRIIISGAVILTRRTAIASSLVRALYHKREEGRVALPSDTTALDWTVASLLAASLLCVVRSTKSISRCNDEMGDRSRRRKSDDRDKNPDV